MNANKTDVQRITLSEGVLPEEELRKAGEEKASAIIKWAKQFFIRIEFIRVRIDNYFIKRGIIIVKTYNVTFIKQHFTMAPREAKEFRKSVRIPDRVILFAESTHYQKIQIWHDYYTLQNEIKANIKDPAIKTHWILKFEKATSLKSLFSDKGTQSPAITQLNDLFKKCQAINPNWLTHKKFAFLVTKVIGDRDIGSTTGEQLSLLQKAVEMASKSKSHEDILFNALLALKEKDADALNFYVQYGFLLEAQQILLKDNHTVEGFTNNLIEVKRVFEEQMQAFENPTDREEYAALCKDPASKILGDSLEGSVETLKNQGRQLFYISQFTTYFNGLASRCGPELSDQLRNRFVMAKGVSNGVVDFKTLPTYKILEQLDEQFSLAQQLGKQDDLNNFIKKFSQNLTANPEASIEKIWKASEKDWKIVETNLKNALEDRNKAEIKQKETMDTLTEGSGNLLALGRWAKQFSTPEKPDSIAQAKAFIDELGVEYLTDSLPGKDTEKSNDIKKLYSFYTDVLGKKGYQPALLARALHALIKAGQFHQVVDELGKSLSITFLNATEKKLINVIYPKIALIEAQKARKAKKEARRIQQNTFSDLLKTNPFSLAEKLLPVIIGKLLPESDREKLVVQLESALHILGPYVNPLIASEKFSDLQSEFIDSLYDALSDTIEITSNEQRAFVIGKIKRFLNKLFGISINQKGLGMLVANGIVEANDAYITTEKMTNKEEMEKLSPLQEALLVHLPKLATASPFAEGVVSIGASLLGGGLAQWIGGKVVKKLIFAYIDNSDLSDKQKTEYKNNTELMDAVASVLGVVLSVIPRLKEKHDLSFYSQAIVAFNAMVHSELPVDEDQAADKVKEVVKHILDKDFAHYEGPILAAVAELPKLVV